MNQETINGKIPIVNGDVNPSLTFEEMVQFPDEIIREFVYRIIGKYKTGSRVDESGVLVDLAADFDLKKVENIAKEKEAKEALKFVKEVEAKILDEYYIKNSILEHRRGKEIYEFQKKMKFGGELIMSPEKLRGYVSAIGFWNNFEPNRIKRAITRTEEIIPKLDYGINNCNTGKTKRTWSINGAAIYLSSGYQTDEMLEKWKDIKPQLESIWRGVFADEFSMHIDHADTGRGPYECGVKYRMWWD